MIAEGILTYISCSFELLQSRAEITIWDIGIANDVNGWLFGLTASTNFNAPAGCCGGIRERNFHPNVSLL